ncbi:hypothetical protein ACTFIV_005417 [Dictyostelium citrinum]
MVNVYILAIKKLSILNYFKKIKKPLNIIMEQKSYGIFLVDDFLESKLTNSDDSRTLIKKIEHILMDENFYDQNNISNIEKADNLNNYDSYNFYKRINSGKYVSLSMAMLLNPNSKVKPNIWIDPRFDRFVTNGGYQLIKEMT